MLVIEEEENERWMRIQLAMYGGETKESVLTVRAMGG
jgi:hypothetical protein